MLSSFYFAHVDGFESEERWKKITQSLVNKSTRAKWVAFKRDRSHLHAIHQLSSFVWFKLFTWKCRKTSSFDWTDNCFSNDALKTKMANLAEGFCILHLFSSCDQLLPAFFNNTEKQAHERREETWFILAIISQHKFSPLLFSICVKALHLWKNVFFLITTEGRSRHKVSIKRKKRAVRSNFQLRLTLFICFNTYH